MVVHLIKDHSEKKMYKAKLHDGEVEVMILAQEQKADLIILDDNAAKKTKEIEEGGKVDHRLLYRVQSYRGS